MATKKISALSTGTTANSGDKIPIERSGANYYITPAMIQAGAAGWTPKRVKVRNGSAQSCSDATQTTITFDTEVYDTDTMHDTGTNPERLTGVTSGQYLITGTGYFSSNSTGYRYMAIYLNNNLYTVQSTPAINGTITGLNISEVITLTPGDYVELRVYQNSTGSLNFNGQEFSATQVA